MYSARTFLGSGVALTDRGAAERRKIMSFAVQSNISQSYQYGSYNSNVNRRDTDYEKEFMGAATSRTTSSDKGENIGIMTIGNRGFIAKYADSSTEQDPIIKVGDYEVRVNDVDPHNATKVEMFALMSYMDDKGLIENTGMKSFNKMTAYGMQAEYNGFCSGLSDPDLSWSMNRDWTAILENAKESFLKIPEAYHQGLNCESIIAGLERWAGAEYGNKDKSIADYSDKEWDRMLEEVDQEIQDMKIATANESEKSVEKQKAYNMDSRTELLTARYTSFIKKGQVKDPDTGRTITSGYIDRNFYTRTGIISSRSSLDSRENVFKDKYNWKVDFNSDDDYERTMRFLDRIPEDDNTVFTTREAFWQDFISGEIDEDEFFAFYETLDHGVANFIKQDENGKNYIDNEMMNSKYFKYFGLQQVTTVPWDDLQKGLEQSALRERGYVHEDPHQETTFNLYDSLKEAFASSGTEEFRFYGEDSFYSLDEWVQEIIRRAHMGLMDSLFVA